ncbi:hypothetical protein BDV27DRAFT_156412 [Aspergillus caelatus]|uniref:Uncharacterized protein n=1 Tax=Aspergillus caelatus TaxID=61420 RepID=A0A5N7A835_9EURO|nr:uncharacterized protein BDV27DRAFT_156412 [Aspergillus caelatus]KAE8365982.1 hypothetical protein BDV27DRAFT_156412 [Aspergillus caelatus]
MAENHQPSSTHRMAKRKNPSNVGREPPLKSESSDDDAPLSKRIRVCHKGDPTIGPGRSESVKRRRTNIKISQEPDSDIPLAKASTKGSTKGRRRWKCTHETPSSSSGQGMSQIKKENGVGGKKLTKVNGDHEKLGAGGATSRITIGDTSAARIKIDPTCTVNCDGLLGNPLID